MNGAPPPAEEAERVGREERERATERGAVAEGEGAGVERVWDRVVNGAGEERGGDTHKKIVFRVSRLVQLFSELVGPPEGSSFSFCSFTRDSTAAILFALRKKGRSVAI